ncbi:MAG: hypothetical protein ACOH10_12895 [Rhodoglobus sp.]
MPTPDTIEAAHRVVADRVDTIVVERASGQIDVQTVENITATKARTIPWSRVTKAYAALRGMEQCPACTGLGMVPPRH